MVGDSNEEDETRLRALGNQRGGAKLATLATECLGEVKTTDRGVDRHGLATIGTPGNAHWSDTGGTTHSPGRGVHLERTEIFGITKHKAHAAHDKAPQEKAGTSPCVREAPALSEPTGSRWRLNYIRSISSSGTAAPVNSP